MATQPSPDTSSPTTSEPTNDATHASLAAVGNEWWRDAVIYQIYPRSFADSDGDGIGDIRGATRHFPELADLGVDAVWFSPFFRSPQRDAGYDISDYCDIDPIFGTLDDFDAMIARAHDLGMRVIVDLVPNHSSDQHPWFQEALAAPEGSAQRDHYIFRDGKGQNGELPPNNWESVFGGPAWTRVTRPDGTPGQWYLHIFDSTQPDFNWEDEWVRERFRGVLRFWLDRGVDGFRVDVAHGLFKAAGLPDYTPPAESGSMGGGVPLEPEIHEHEDEVAHPYWGQPGVHEIYRDWHDILAEYDGDRALCAEAWVDPPTRLAQWVRPDEMHQAFNFAYLETPWKASALRTVIDTSLQAFSDVGAPSTWVLSNHDVVRHASRLALTAANPQGHGIGPKSPGQPNRELGLRRARAASAFMLALPGSAYLYQGEELGLPEVIDLPDSVRQDPTWVRTNGERYGRDGCRVPIPWKANAPAYGFTSTGEAWLPQPGDWGPYARDVQTGDPTSTLELYRAALALRREHNLGFGSIEWLEGYPKRAAAFRSGRITVIANTGRKHVDLPAGRIIITSATMDDDRKLPSDTTAWILDAS